MKTAKVEGFKYISCSYLSTTREPPVINTFTFKYISCSYLSQDAQMKTAKVEGFKYISCSYLSNVFITIFSSIV